MPPKGSRVHVDIFPDGGEWSVEVSLVDSTMHKTYGNPLVLDTVEDEEAARIEGEVFARSHGYTFEVRKFDGN